ncbi:MAG: mRNA splicing protein [Bathelium mastoideum]|nr:MAG: mRNA splicing protein [Bathelium mastoideum]
MAPPPKNPTEPAKNSERNEYIPSFISKKPFYVNDLQNDDDYLEHQRLQQKDTASDSKWYDRGRKLGPAATKFRKGACENCGAMTHKTKECLSRPRKAGAKWTGKNIQADEMVQEVQLGWDAKRDRWNGYDSREYDAVVEEYSQLEEMKKKAKSAEGEDGQSKSLDEEQGADEGDRYEAETDMGRKQATSTRNLRIREDTAKYLLNLDLESAKYDPKTRSMVDSGATADNAAALVAEEGFMRASGDAAEFEKAQRYAWETQERDGEKALHLQAMPTSGEFMRKKQLEEKRKVKGEQKKALLDKYGGQEHLQQKRPEVAETERYVEYDDRGKVIKGESAKKAKSKYAEDVFINNHTSAWGSWWSNFKWGYACCHSTSKNSYCTGEEGKRAFEQSNRLRIAEDLPSEDVPKSIARQEDLDEERHVPNGVQKDDKQRVDDTERHKRTKRTVDEMIGGVTEEEMEEYRKKRAVANDPMAKLLGKDELVH